VRILALETSTSIGTVATLDASGLVRQAELPSGKRTAQSLAPAIAAQLAAAGWTPAQVELVTTTCGPGSFTGLRIAVTTAKTLAYATGASLVGLDTLEVIAAQSSVPGPDLHVVLDAQRNQLFARRFDRDASDRWLPSGPPRIMDIDAWLAQLHSPTTVTGLGLKRVMDRLPPGVRVAPADGWAPQACTVARLALEQFLAGRRDDLWHLVPNYCRQSAAEEKELGDRS
jgi:tRNA threonylcarbamoyladenosine biosynthesis protein TsaB